MRIVRKFAWLLLTMGLLALTVQTTSPIALGLAACMVLLPLLCLLVNLYAAKKLRLAVRLPVNLRKGESGTAELTVQNRFPNLPAFLPCAAGKPAERRDADRKRERRHLAEGQADNEDFSAKPVVRTHSLGRGIRPFV